MNNLEVLAMYLPQFHRCKENDLWWGEGFTEWTLVKKAQPLYNGHQQPRTPIMGYYNLQDATFMGEQFDIAQKYGITGFNVYLYWSVGSKLLDAVIESLLKNKDINTRYCFTWANHPWTRTWSNRSGAKETLFPQEYEVSREEMEEFADYLYKFFQDARYIKIYEKPLIYIYKPEDIPSLSRFISSFREIFQTKFHIEVHIVGFINNQKDNYSYLDCFDEVAIFNPTAALFSRHALFEKKGVNLSARFIFNNLKSPKIKSFISRLSDCRYYKYTIYDYERFWMNIVLQYSSSQKLGNLPVQPMAVVDFDNTPRYGKRAKIFKNVNYKVFKSGIKQLIRIINKQDNNHKILLINAWNEWGEGMHLEPDKIKQYDFLMSLKEAVVESGNE